MSDQTMPAHTRAVYEAQLLSVMDFMVSAAAKAETNQVERSSVEKLYGKYLVKGVFSLDDNSATFTITSAL